VRNESTRRDLKRAIVDLCFRCHGVMGKRLHDLDRPSFLRRDHEVKDNRVLAAEWSSTGPDPSLNGEFLDATFPKGEAAKDPDYRNGKGTDTVSYRIELPPDVDPSRVSIRATLYYQSIPPS
jgi:hypothetical protein